MRNGDGQTHRFLSLEVNKSTELVINKSLNCSEINVGYFIVGDDKFSHKLKTCGANTTIESWRKDDSSNKTLL